MVAAISPRGGGGGGNGDGDCIDPAAPEPEVQSPFFGALSALFSSALLRLPRSLSKKTRRGKEKKKKPRE